MERAGRPLGDPLLMGEPGTKDPLVVPEAYVSKGMTLGYMTDFFGNKLRDVASPVSGVVIYVGAIPSMKKGDNVAYVGEIVDTP